MTDTSSGSGSGDSADDPLVPDDQLPKDLQPDDNPLARDPDDERNSGNDGGDGGPGGNAGDVEGMTDGGPGGQPG